MGTSFGDLLSGLAVLNRSRSRRSLTKVAETVHLSPGRAQRVFTRLVGESPARYQHRVALEKAAAELASSDRPVAEIAMANGFGSHEGFTRAFTGRYGRSPSVYRKQLDQRWTKHQAAEATGTSPCVGLYHVALHAPTVNHQEDVMEQSDSQPVDVRDLDPVPVLYMERRIDRDQFADVLAELLPAVFGYVMEEGLAMAGPPYVRYMDQSAAFLSVQAGIPLADRPKPPPPERSILAGELPGGPAATTIHRGPYDTLGESHMVLDRWMAANGRTAAGPPWEVYLTDPGEVPNPEDWETDIVWPIT